jgi:hypothetical protein
MTVRTDWQTPFLEELARAANIEAACVKAMIDRQTYYNWVDKKRKRNAAFIAKVEEALDVARDVLRREIHRRAVAGVPRPQFTKGGQPIMEMVGPGEAPRQYVEQEYSDTLLIRLSIAHLPEFKEKQTIEHTGKDGKPLAVKILRGVSMDDL